MIIKKIKWQLWEMITNENEVIYGTSKKDCLRQLEEQTRQKATETKFYPNFLKKRPKPTGVKMALKDV